MVGLHRDAGPGGAPGQAGQRLAQAKVVQDRRAQAADGGASLIQRQVDELPGEDELLGGEPQRFPGRAGVIQGAGRRVQVVAQAEQPLGDAVVDVGGQSPPLRLLRGDDLLGEAGEGVLACLKLPVPCLSGALRGQWKTPSRSATVTAPARSPTSSLR